MKLRYKLGMSVLLLSVVFNGVSGQEEFLSDTVFMNAVEITVARSYRFTPLTVTSIETGSLSRFQTDDIGLLLRASTSLSVKRNGNTGIASVSMRGMSASHTRVTWNGISISSPSSGMSDFALIPVCAASSVLISGGGADLGEIAGSLGGKVELSSVPAAFKGSKASLILNAGSFDEYSSILSFSTGNGTLTSNTTVWGKMADNDFIYRIDDGDGETLNLRRKNASYNNHGFTQNLLLKNDRSSLSAHLWYNMTERNLPGPVVTEEQNYGEAQNDRSLRGALNFSTSKGKAEIDLIAGYTNDINLYFNEVPDYNGDNRSSVITGKARIGYNVSEKTVLTLNIGDEYQTGRSLAFDENKHRNLLSASFSAVYMPASRLKLSLQAREVLSDTRLSDPEFTAGAAFFASSDGKHIIKANVSRNVNLPCMNDLYWNPGGNPDLRPEISTGGEAGYSFNYSNQSSFQGTFDLTLFASEVKDLIQWMPDETFTIWYPTNIMRVAVKGAETRLTSAFPISHGRITAGTAYSYTSSITLFTGYENDPSIGKQLVYIPLHHFSANVSASYFFMRGGVMIAMESKRYTVTDNSAWLDNSCIVDANIGSAFSFDKISLLADLTVKNLLNSSWESVRYFPMPLRTYSVSLKFIFSSTSSNN